MAITKGSYNAPAAGQNTPGGSYGAPTPHAAQVDQMPYTAPSGQTAPGSPAPCAGFDAMDGLGMATPTPGEAAETPQIAPGGGWTELT